mmetsp:Transcript_21464/g.64079  ORF Transcript_21464/g.64079 Transcript_21464/m.64079 type:complete len:369 (-) Transcript_21464:28-1134(-)
MVFKRPAGAVGAAGKRQRLGPVQRLCATVDGGISQPAGVPKVVQRMLSDMLEASLATPVGERHKFQASVVGMIGQVLSDTEASLQEEVSRLGKDVATAEGDKVKGEAAVREAEATHAVKEAAAAGAKSVLASAAEAVKAATEAVKTAVADQDAAENDIQAAGQRRAKLAGAMEECTAPLVDGSVEEGAMRSLVIKLVQVLKGYQLDQSMMTAIPEALSKKPLDRGHFDTMVVQQLNDEVSKRLAAFDRTIQDAEMTRAACVSTLQAAESSEAAAKQQRVMTAQAYLAAQAAHRESANGLEGARQALAGAQQEIEQTLEWTEDAKARLADFRAGSLAAFVELRDREAPKEPEPAPAAEEGVVEAVPATA